MLARLAALVRKEFIQIRRDRRTLAIMIVIPVLWLIVFGYAFSFDVSNVKVGVIDRSGNSRGALIAQAIKGYEKFKPVTVDSSVQARDLMRHGKLSMLVEIPPGWGQQQAAGEPPSLSVLVDGSELFTAQAGGRLLSQALQPIQEKLVSEIRAESLAQILAILKNLPPGTADASQFAPPSMPSLLPKLEFLYNPNLKSAPVMIPGLLGMVLLVVTTMMTALGIVRERETGTLEQLIVTPIRPFELILGKLLPYVAIGLFDFVLVLLAGMLLFGLHFVGSLPVFSVLALLFLFCALGLGILISTIAQNQAQAMQLAAITFVVQILLSGFVFPLASMPAAILPISYALPFTYFVPIARGMFLKGLGLSDLWRQAAVLLGYAIVITTISTVRFRKRIG
ncbi:MAG: ABC transporter permease [Actinomycetota bacterium]